MLYIDASNDYAITKREVMVKGQTESYVNDNGELVWISLPAKLKIKLEKRDIHLAKTFDGRIVVFKSDDAVGTQKRYENSFGFSYLNVGQDRFLVSPRLNGGDIKVLSKILDLNLELANRSSKSLWMELLDVLAPRQKHAPLAA